MKIGRKPVVQQDCRLQRFTRMQKTRGGRVSETVSSRSGEEMWVVTHREYKCRRGDGDAEIV